MNRNVAMIHATRAAIEPAHTAMQEALPDVEIVHYLDEALLSVAKKKGPISPEVSRRLLRMLVSAEEGGACVALMTCSSLTANADFLEPMVRFPIVKIDTPMMERAISLGAKIGVVATMSSAVDPAREQLEQIARERGVNIEPRFVVVKGAFQALLDKDTETHDRLVMEKIRGRARSCDAIIPAQASIARVAARKDLNIQAPILTSPPLAAARVKEIYHREEKAFHNT